MPDRSQAPADAARDAVVSASMPDNVRRLSPLIRQHANRTERDRRLAAPVVQAMRDAGLFRMFTPRALGGLELDPVTVARIVEEVAAADSAAGWALQAGNTGAWWAARFPTAGVDELFGSGPDVVMSASFSPPHHAEAVPGGYRFTGAGPLASTIHDAPWVFMTGIVHDDGRPRTGPAGPVVAGFALRTSDVRIDDTWHSLGMRGTDSNDIAAEDLFVPEARSFVVMPEYEPEARFTGPLYRLPAMAATGVVVVPVALAIARGAITAVRELADRKTPLGSTKTMRHRPAVQAALADAEAEWRSARLFFYDTLEAAWRRAVAAERPTLEQRADLMLASAHAVRAASRVADAMHRMGGSSGIYERSPLERHFRDAQTVRHHGFLSESRFETVGQVYLGLEPEFAMVAF